MTLSELNRKKQTGQSKQNHMRKFHLSSLLQIDYQDIISSLGQKKKKDDKTHIQPLHIFNELRYTLPLLLQIFK